MVALLPSSGGRVCQRRPPRWPDPRGRLITGNALWLDGRGSGALAGGLKAARRRVTVFAGRLRLRGGPPVLIPSSAPVTLHIVVFEPQPSTRSRSGQSERRDLRSEGVASVTSFEAHS